MADFLRYPKGPAACLSGLLLLLFTGSAAATAHAGCPPARTRVIARDRVLRVYSAEAKPFAGVSVGACLAGHSGHMTLVEPAPRTSIGTVALSGPVVAYLTSSFGVDSGSTSLVVADVATRRILRKTPVGAWTDAGLLFERRVTDLVVARDGASAWIETHHGPGPGAPRSLAVHAAGPTGAPAVLDEGPAIVATSLTRSGHTLSWTDGGTRRSAPLPS